MGEIIILTIAMIISVTKNSFILVLFILLLTNHLLVTFFLIMPSDYRCPNCHSEEIFEYEEFIECPQCGRRWHKDYIPKDVEDDEDRLSREEMYSFLDAFEEFTDEETRKRFFKSIDKDLEE
ncbi:MAG: hypothetical protein JSV62_13045 [Promethearchaeota archaeon]|nr:MAG: hypothetical protein JSV62_13045 [Candidatus Lokiarchaeota archaeon]